MDASSLAVRLLGSFRLTQDDQPVKSFGQARLQFLLAYLVLHGGVSLSRQQLAGLRAQLGDEHFHGAWTLGRALAKEQAVRLALEMTAA